MNSPDFPHLPKSISNYMFDQEGNIPRNKVLTVGAMLLLLSVILADDAFAAHSSHSSHRSHSSHSSHSSGAGGHASHVSHTSHTSHTSATGYTTHSSHSSATYTTQANPVVHNSHSNVAPEPVVHNSHNNVAPSLEELNAMRQPSASDVADIAGDMKLIGFGQVPPETTGVPIATVKGES